MEETAVKHTKGTWTIDPARPDYHGRALGYYVCNVQTGGRIGQVFENCLVKTCEEALANARLFASAPALTAVLNRYALGDWDGGDSARAVLEAAGVAITPRKVST